VNFTCLQDCPPSLLITGLAFLLIAALGYALARWRRWTLLVWVPATFLVAGPFLSNGWGIDAREWIAMAGGWAVAVLGALRRHKTPVPKEAA
jgi:hypothetical protein